MWQHLTPEILLVCVCVYLLSLQVFVIIVIFKPFVSFTYDIDKCKMKCERFYDIHTIFVSVDRKYYQQIVYAINYYDKNCLFLLENLYEYVNLHVCVCVSLCKEIFGVFPPILPLF